MFLLFEQHVLVRDASDFHAFTIAHVPSSVQVGKLVYCTRTVPEMEKVRGVSLSFAQLSV